jgi:hypothetical protein
MVGTKYHPSMARKGGALAAAAAMLLLAACSGNDGDATPATTPAPVATTAATPAPTTTSAPPTTQAPTTTIDPAQTLAAEVEADLLEAFRLGREAWQDPFNQDKEQAALDRRLGVVRDDLAASLKDYRTRNYALRPNEVVPSSVTIEGSPEFPAASNDFAQVRVCEVNSWILVEVGAGPNGSDAIVNQDVIVTRSDVFMRNVDGVWKFEGGNEIREWQGLDECPAE